MKKLFLTLAVVLGVIFIGGCSGKNDEKNILIVGTNPEFAPFEYMEGSEIKGFDIDLVNEIANKLGKKVEIKSMNFDGLLPALQTDKIDMVIAGMTATEERKKHVNFTQNYYVSQQALIVKNPDIKELNELIGGQIGVVLGYTGDVFISGKPEFKVERYNSSSASILALQGDKVNAVILDEEPAKQYAKKNKGLYVLAIEGGKEEYAIAINKKNAKLLDEVEKALAELKQDGTYEKLYNKYFGN